MITFILMPLLSEGQAAEECVTCN